VPLGPVRLMVALTGAPSYPPSIAARLSLAHSAYWQAQETYPAPWILKTTKSYAK
jgi:hypothetical protein